MDISAVGKAGHQYLLLLFVRPVQTKVFAQVNVPPPVANMSVFYQNLTLLNLLRIMKDVVYTEADPQLTTTLPASRILISDVMTVQVRLLYLLVPNKVIVRIFHG